MPKSEPIRMLRVAAKADGYRREGLKFSVMPTDIPLSLLTSSQVQRLKSDSMLKCKEVDEQPDLAIAPEELSELRDKAAMADAVLSLVPHDYLGSAIDYVALLQEVAQQPAPAEPETAPETHGAKTSTKPHGK